MLYGGSRKEERIWEKIREGKWKKRNKERVRCWFKEENGWYECRKGRGGRGMREGGGMERRGGKRRRERRMREVRVKVRR
ncbi:hypothetical protein E3A20_25780 [Planctomyces bekefii]|uniref:Uncharacterized protein n=1 Tax=Planctomyces bekefii TaxID=1653850 RepID=A0A5C6M2N0_9PLAN|nr:hypothetical protein E3A20_25780 [Planctomyces bekefii]